MQPESRPANTVGTQANPVYANQDPYGGQGAPSPWRPPETTPNSGYDFHWNPQQPYLYRPPAAPQAPNFGYSPNNSYIFPR